MKRYLFGAQQTERVDTDVVIIGSGAAGLYAALNLESTLRCIILNKAGPLQSNSMYAQGGIATVIQPNEIDDPEQHFEDTLVAGAGHCDEKAVRVLVEEAWSNISQLLDMQVPFDTKEGHLLLTREGGHGRDRILHSGGDATGLHLTNRLYELVKQKENLTILDRMFLADIITDETGTVGVIALDQNEKPTYFAASKVIVASGGIGRVFRNSTNAVCATGDGIAAASRAGARLKDMEFIQFHPTALVHPDDNGRFFLISEALRGEGAVLRNRRGEAFMQGVHPLADLAPRDIVARAIIMEMKRSDIPNVYLDITAQKRSFLKSRFPNIYEKCMSCGIDIAIDWIPVLPVQHYFMGGIETDVNGRTNIPRLYACGESACTGVHGANRLASNSLLECLVFGRRCARDISASERVVPPRAVQKKSPYKPKCCVDFESYSSEVRTLMTYKCGIIRNETSLREAQARIETMFAELDGMELTTAKGIETYNQTILGRAILQASIERKVSMGAHFRSDEACVGGSKNEK